MSAPPSTFPAPPTMPTMVSRLPKFSFRTAPGAPQASAAQGVPAAAAVAAAAAGTAVGGVSPGAPLTNGSNHQPPTPAPTTTSTATGGVVKYNGFLRMPAPLSISWTKKGKAGVQREDAPGWKNGAAAAPSDVITTPQQQQQQQPSPPPTTQRFLKKPNAAVTPTTITTATVAAKGRGFGFALPQLGPKGLPVVKNGAGGTRPGQKAAAAAAGLTNGTKSNLNSHGGSAQRLGALRQPAGPARPNGPGGSRPGSPLFRKQPAGRSQSSDSLRTAGPSGGGGPSVRLLSEKDRLRSRSLNQMQRQPSATLLATASASSSSTSLATATSSLPRITRSYSLNRAADRGAKEQPKTSPASRLLPRRFPAAPVIRSPLTKHIPWGDASSSPLPLSNLRKPLLPSTYPTLKASTLGANRPRPSLIRQPRPLRVTPATRTPNHDQEVGTQGPAGRRNSLESPAVTPSTTENSPGTT